MDTWYPSGGTHVMPCIVSMIKTLFVKKKRVKQLCLMICCNEMSNKAFNDIIAAAPHIHFNKSGYTFHPSSRILSNEMLERLATNKQINRREKEREKALPIDWKRGKLRQEAGRGKRARIHNNYTLSSAANITHKLFIVLFFIFFLLLLCADENCLFHLRDNNHHQLINSALRAIYVKSIFIHSRYFGSFPDFGFWFVFER